MNNKTSSVLKIYQNISAIVGLISGIIAIVVYIKKLKTFYLIIFIAIFILSFLIFYLLFKCYKSLKLRISFSEKRIPISMHSNWNVNSERLKLLVEGFDFSLLKKIEISSLILLIADRLDTEAWSKTLVARFIKNKKSLSPVGSLTGTYMVLESLRFYNYHNNQNLIRNLSTLLTSVFTNDGTVIHSYEPTSAGGNQIKPEVLRHFSGFFLIRPFINNEPTKSDILLFNNICKDLESRIKKKEEKDLQETAFAIEAVLKGIYWIKDHEKSNIEIIKSSLDFMIDLEQLSVPGHIAWSEEPGAAAASNTASQWVVAWLLSSLVSWKEIQKSKRIMLADRLLNLIELNMSSVPDNKRLLPHSFTGGIIRNPSGESMLATSIALYISILIYTVFKDKNIFIRSENCILNLLNRINAYGLQYTTIDCLDGPMEGYLAWSANLLGLRPLFYNNNEKLKAVNTLKQVIFFSEENKKFTQNVFSEREKDTLMRSIKKINEIYYDANAKIYKNGLFQPLGEIIN